MALSRTMREALKEREEKEQQKATQRQTSSSAAGSAERPDYVVTSRTQAEAMKERLQRENKSGSIGIRSDIKPNETYIKTPVSTTSSNKKSRVLIEAQLADAKARLKANSGYNFDSSAMYDSNAIEASRKRTQAQVDAYNDIKRFEAELEDLKYIERWGSDTYTEIEEPNGFVDKVKNFYNQSMANMGAMRMGIETNEAFADYAANPTEANKQRALEWQARRDQYNERNAAAMDDEGAVLPIISQNAAGYIPQAIDQGKGFLKGGAVGGAIGAGLGSFAGPAGTVAGAKLGAKIGGSIGSGASMYDDVKGAAIEGFMSAGADIETATKAANDEAVLSSIVEAAETGLDIAAFGTSRWAKLLLSYLQNIGSEGVEEGIQQAASIANRNRMANGEELPDGPIRSILDLAGDTMGTLLGAAFNTNPDERAEIWDAAKEGAKTAAVVGGVQRVGGYAAQKAVEPVVNKWLENTPTESTKTPTETEVTPSEQVVTPSAPESATVEPVNQALMDAAGEMVRQEQQTEPAETSRNAPAVQPTQVQSEVSATNNNLPAQQKKTSQEASLPKYGRNGMATFAEIVESSDKRIDEVQRDFEAAYQAGLTELPREAVNLVGWVQKQAYAAGLRDYNISAKKAVEQPAVWNKAPGLVSNDSAKKLNRRTRTAIDNLGKATGAQIIMVKSLADVPEAGGRDGNGLYVDGTIYISETADNPFMEVAKHEVTHHLQKSSSEAYIAFRNYAIQKMNADLPYGSRTKTEQKQAAYAEQDVYLDTEGAMDEVVAQFAEKLLSDEKAMREFVQEVSGSADTRTWGQKVIDAIHDFVEKVRKAFGKGKQANQALLDEYGITIEQFEQIEKLWKDAVRAAEAKSEQFIDEGSVEEGTGGVKFSLVTDKKTLEFLNGQKAVKVYRAMQEIDGKLYPPMAALIKGETGKKQLVEATKKGAWYQADEHPELIKLDKNGKPKFELNKGNGSMVPAAYNPYFHTSASPLNDQFSSAYDRPNIVVVEGYIPESELTSGYKAQYAKDSVGETSWHAGPVASKLKGAKARRVFLSRWFKAERVVPVDEVAQIIAKTLQGEDVSVPWNVVTPSLRVALEAEGVPIDYKDVKMGSKVVSFESTQEGRKFSLKGTNKHGIEVYETSDEVKALSWDERKQRFLDLMANEYSGRTAKFVRNGHAYYAQFTKSDVNKTLYGDKRSDEVGWKAKINTGADGNIFELVENAQYNGSRPESGKNTAAHKGVRYWDYFIKKVQVDGRVFDLVANVRQRDDGRYVYSIQMNRDKKTEAAPPTAYSKRDASNRAQTASTTTNVAQQDKSVKFSLKDSSGKELTQEQAEYFKDSKIRDSKGRLRVVYHGTTAEFNTFKRGDVGYHFGNKTTARTRVGRGKNARLLECYINITNPIEFDEDLGSWDADYRLTVELVEKGILTEEEARRVLRTDDGRYARATGTANQKLREVLLAKGYDGIVYSNYFESSGSKSYIVFESKQAKRVDNGAPTTNPDIRFSLKEPVEETKNLIALHNLTADKLLKSLKLGGFPMPSIAVTKVDIPHTNFGEITLVMNKSTVDPKASRKNTVYSADAWTPTFPKVEYEINRDVERSLYDMAYKAKGAIPEDYIRTIHNMAGQLEYYLNTYETEDAVRDRLAKEYAFKALYLADKGEKVESKTRENRVEKAKNDMLEAVLKVFDEDIETLSKTPFNALHSKYAEAVKQVLIEHGRTEEAAEKMVAKKGGLVGGFDKLIGRVIRYAEEPSVAVETVPDTKGIEQDIDSRIDPKAYDRWLSNMLSGLVKDSGIYNGKDIFTPSGNRRTFKQTHYPVTLDNIAKAMAAQNGGSTKNVMGFVGVKSLRAGTAERFKSIADMHKREGRLKHLSEEENAAIIDALDKRLVDVMDRIYESSSRKNERERWMMLDSIGNILMEVTEQPKCTVDSISKVFGQYGYKLGNQLAMDIRDLLFDVSEMPVNLFEAKPERAVRFDEVLAAVVPNTAPAELRNGLEQAGVRVMEYQEGDDTDRLAKVNSVDDARFSLKEQENLQRENAKLKEVNTALREQFKTTKFAKVDKKALDKFTKRLLQDYSSGADINDTRNALDDLFTYIANGEDGESAAWDVAYRRAWEVAQNIIEQSVEVDDTDYQETKAIRESVRKTGLTLPREYSSSLVGYDGINDFRKRNFGRIKLVNNGLPVDTFFEELATEYPGYFDRYEHTNPADQLIAIVEFLDEHQPVEFNRYERNMRGATTWLANDIMERFFELPQGKPTFADKAERKLTEQAIKGQKKLDKLREQKNERIKDLIRENREKVKKAVLGERMAGQRELAAQKRKHEDRLAKMSDSRKATVLRTRIAKHTNELSTKLLSPTDKRHIPDDLRGTVTALLKSINLESQYTIDEVTGKRQKNGDGAPVKRTELFRQLMEQYQRISKEGSMVVDPSLLGDEETQGNFAKAMALGETRVADMNLEELNTLWSVIRSVEHSITTANKVLSKAKFQRTTDWAEAIKADTATRRPMKGKWMEAFRLDLENPYTFFSHYGEAGKAIFRMLRDAQDRQQTMVSEVQAAVEKIVDPKTVEKLEKEVHEFTTERGDKLTLTTAHIMELHLLMKREQARDHLMKGGIVQPEVEGKKITRGSDAILLTFDDLTEIIGSLTSEQTQIADALQKLTSTVLADYGNAASMTAYGYKKFTGTDYWPIKTAKEGRHSNIENGGNNTRSIKNIGLAKNVIPHASNQLDLHGVFETFASHSADMIDYAAWLCPMEDASRLYNFDFRDDAGMRTGKTMKSLLDRVGGKDAQEYWHRLMEDIQNGLKAPNDTTIIKPISRAIGNARGAAVGANIRVIIQQPTAILRAAVVLSPADMAKGLVSGGGWKTALKHSAIAQRKDMGGFDISSPMQMGEILFDKRTKMQKFNEAMMWGAGKADAVAWGRVWNACEHAVQKDRPGLSGDAFYEAVDELFTDVIDQSQVVDGVLQRSQVMRSGNMFVNQATAFMGEPTMAMNLLLRTYDGMRREQNDDKRKAARQAFGRAAIVLLATNTVNAAAQSLVDAWRDDDDDKEYWERVKSAFTGISGEEETKWEKAVAAVLNGNLGSSLDPLTYIPFVKDGLSLIQGYNVTRADADIMGDLIAAGDDFVKVLKGENKKTIAYTLKNLSQQVGKVFGVSAPNLLRDVWGVVRSIAIETGNVELQYEMEKAIYKIGNEDNKNNFVDILYRAYEQGSSSYDHIYNDMIANGIPADKIASRMENLMKKAQGITKTSDLEQRYLAPDQQREYDRTAKSLSSSSVWKQATEAQRDKAEDMLYDIITENDTGLDILEKIDGNISEADYILYKLALSVVDEPNKSGKYGGKPTNAEAEAAIDMLGLDDEESSFLWLMQGMGEKSNPYK